MKSARDDLPIRIRHGAVSLFSASNFLCYLTMLFYIPSGMKYGPALFCRAGGM